MNVSFMNLASTIDKAENSTFIFFQDGELTAQKIGGDVGDMMGKYFKMSGYVAAALDFWSRKLVPDILGAIESGLGKDEYSKILPELELIREKTDRALRAGFQRVDILFKNALYSSMEFLRRLRPQLGKFETGETLKGPFADTIKALVSRVESYKYLGVLIDSKLDHSAWLKQKRSALEHTISALHPVLANHQLTVNYRSRIFSAVVMGKAYYGLELVGGNKSHLAPLQTTINKGIRLFTGARLSTAIGPLLVETGIGSSSHSLIGITDNDVFTLNVQGQLVRSQRWFWSRRTKQLYRNRYWLTPQVRPKTVKQRHSFALMETLRTCGDSASLQKYVTRQLLDTSGFFKDPSFDQSRAHDTRYLMLARMDALWTARKAIQIGILVDTHPFSVDHCILCDQQLLSTSIAHLVVECEQVTGHRIQSGLVPAIQKSRLRLLGRALDPGVENVYTWLRGGVLNGEADLDQRWLDGTVEHESMGTRHDNRALAARLADFLQVAYRQYQSTLWKYHRDRLVEVG
ncbi:hypothetical protein BASA62_001714 [Batrachochytrium salamandrivorans]|nr:hypothetical protein BASA62_001714 [Batrachochytrium salamandrivorans]